MHEVELRGLHEGPELNKAVAEALRYWLGSTASTRTSKASTDQTGAVEAGTVESDEAMLGRRKELTQKFVSGEWGVELAGYEAGREADRRKSAERARPGASNGHVDRRGFVDRSHASAVPAPLKQFVATYIDDPDARLAEPIAFELLRNATAAEARQLTAHFQNMVQLATPGDLWTRAAELGRDCRKSGITVGSLDLLIAHLAIHHGAELITFDNDYLGIASVSALQVRLLQRPGQQT